MANRFENIRENRNKWHDQELKKIWDILKNSTNFYMQRWPFQMERPVSAEKARQKERTTPVAS